MDSLVTLCALGIMALIGIAILMMIMRSFSGTPRGYSEYGPEQPHYDDPNVRSRGWFGGRRSGGAESPRYDSPDVQSRGWFGGRRSSGSSSSKPSGNRVDSPNVKSRGGFGGKK